LKLQTHLNTVNIDVETVNFAEYSWNSKII